MVPKDFGKGNVQNIGQTSEWLHKLSVAGYIFIFLMFHTASMKNMKEGNFLCLKVIYWKHRNFTALPNRIFHFQSDAGGSREQGIFSMAALSVIKKLPGYRSPTMYPKHYCILSTQGGGIKSAQVRSLWLAANDEEIFTDGIK